ncbi:MAG: hypothetical protein JSW50_07330, partial [Candidatus Latescibacterota bacterium]
MTRSLILAMACLSVLVVCPSLTNADSSQSKAPARADTTTHKSGFKDGGLGGPTSVPNQLEEQDAVSAPAFRFPGIDNFLSPYFAFKGRIKDKYGLALGMDYAFLYQHASESLGENKAASGIFRAFGRWDLLGRGSPS